MKSLKTKLVAGFLGLLTISSSLISCNDDDASSGGPVINNVNDVVENTPVTQGYAGNMYIIQGKGFTDVQKIYFNDVDTYFNSTMVTDTNIFVTIDRDTPYENGSEELTVVTKNGSATYHFVVAPPAPLIQSFNPINALPGETVTITGSYFLNPTVAFGTAPAEILSSTLSEIKVIMPEGASHKFLTVTTLSGTGKSWEAVGTSLFDDEWNQGWQDEENLQIVTANDARQGETYLKLESGAWSGKQFHELNWATMDIASYKGIRFSIRADKASQLAVIINGNWGDADVVKRNVTTDWQDVEILWSEWPFAVNGLQVFVLKEFKGEATVYHFDDFGLIPN